MNEALQPEESVFVLLSVAMVLFQTPYQNQQSTTLQAPNSIKWQNTLFAPGKTCQPKQVIYRKPHLSQLQQKSENHI